MWCLITIIGSTYDGRPYKKLLYSWGESTIDALKNCASIDLGDIKVENMECETLGNHESDWIEKALVVEVWK